MRWFLVFVIMMLVSTPILAAELVSYDIDVELDEIQHRLDGVERVRWTNATEAELTEIWFHLYLNAFASSKTTFMNELGSQTLRGGSLKDMGWGWIRCTSIRSENDRDLLPFFEFVRPDDGNMHDYTVAVLRLVEPLQPGDSIVLKIGFEVQLPSVIARTGFAGDFHMVGQWYPKIAVLDPEGWNCHQFHANSEFYADFADYEVSIVVPEHWVVGASGVEVSAKSLEQGGSKKRQVLFRALQVHDFAWCAAPSEMMEVVEADFDPMTDVPQAWFDRAVELTGLPPVDLQLPPMHIRLLVPMKQRQLSERMIRAARLSIAWYGLHFGAYPYPQLTVVSPPPMAEESWGMEYPTFITTGASRLMQMPPLGWLGWIENVTVHEFGHQYFQGLLATNEFERAWMDEGMTSWAELSCLEAIREHNLAPEMKFGGTWAGRRLELASVSSPIKVDRPAWEFRNRHHYFAASYAKSAAVLKTLEGLLGIEVFYRAMRNYYELFRYQHPRGEDFFSVVEAVSAQDLDWFFDQAIRSDVMPDWSVLNVINADERVPEGLVWEEGEWGVGDLTDDLVPAEIQLGRRGGFIAPVDVRIDYADGSSEVRTWDGNERWVKWRLESTEKVDGVVIDPLGVWVLETKRLDNYWSRNRESSTRNEPLWWLGDGLKLLITVIIPWS